MKIAKLILVLVILAVIMYIAYTKLLAKAPDAVVVKKDEVISSVPKTRIISNNSFAAVNPSLNNLIKMPIKTF